MHLNELKTYLNKYFRVNEIEDASLNGLQVEGKQKINKIAFAVDASLEAFEKTGSVGSHNRQGALYQGYQFKTGVGSYRKLG